MKQLIKFYFLTCLLVTCLANAQTTIALGKGVVANRSASQPTPFGHYHKNYCGQNMMPVSEVIDLEYTSGTINALALNVSAVNGNAMPSQNNKIFLTALEISRFLYTHTNTRPNFLFNKILKNNFGLNQRFSFHNSVFYKEIAFPYISLKPMML